MENIGRGMTETIIHTDDSPFAAVRDMWNPNADDGNSGYNKKPIYETGENGAGAAVGTSIAIEAITATEGAHDVSRFDSIWINVRTLIRNTIGALLKEHRTLDEIVKYVTSDINWIDVTIDGYLPGTKVVYYYTGPKYIQSIIASADIKVPHTPKQKELATLEYDAVKLLLERDLGINEFTSRLGDPSSKALMISHLPADLLSVYGFNELVLLESHTGTLKTKPEWSSKMLTATRREHAHRIPFNKLSMTVLGDGGKDLLPKSRKVIDAYINLAVDNRWKSTTTRDKIINDLDKMQDVALSVILKSILK